MQIGQFVGSVAAAHVAEDRDHLCATYRGSTHGTQVCALHTQEILQPEVLLKQTASLFDSEFTYGSEGIPQPSISEKMLSG